MSNPPSDLQSRDRPPAVLPSPLPVEHSGQSSRPAMLQWPQWPPWPDLNLPFPPNWRNLVNWFRVDEARMTEILEQIRAQLPTTEVILIGKPQAGKSSIVQGLTGVSADIIGQGYRPHTQHTQQYFFPTAQLPLLVFTDTVGLGDGMHETSQVIQEVLGELRHQEYSQSGAKVILLTVKVNDFAIDTLQHIAQTVRTQQPEIPCLLAVTCLHELYAPEVVDHPPYPPAGMEVTRAVQQLQTDFHGLYDQMVLLDFTLEEDGFQPTLYGLDSLLMGLSDLLPEAESRALAQLLQERDAAQSIGNLYRDAARRYILPFSVMAGGLAAVPLPLATMPVLTTLQVTLVGLLGQLYGQTLSPSQAGGLVSTIAGGFLAQAIGRELIKFIPGFGSLIAASWAMAYTWALGEAACIYFGDLMGGKTPDPDRIQAVMRQSFAAAKQRLQQPLQPDR